MLRTLRRAAVSFVVLCVGAPHLDAQRVARLVVIPPTLRLEVGETQEVITQASSESGAPIPLDRAGVTYATSDSTIVTINAAGSVLARRAGRAEIIVRAGTLTRRATVIVTRVTTGGAGPVAAAATNGAVSASSPPVTSATGAVAVEGIIQPRVVTLLPSERMRPSFTLKFSDGTEAEAKDVVWKAFGVAASVNDATSEVIGVTEGSASLGATYGSNISASVPIQVVAPNLVADRDSVLLVIGTVDTLHLKVPAQNNRVISQGLAWKSTDPSVIRVLNSTEGIVQARGVGTAVITVDGFTITRTLPVRVSARVARIEASIPPTTPLTLGVGSTLSVTARAVDSIGATVDGATMQWMMRDAAIATVTVAGTILGHQTGTTVLSIAVDGLPPRTWPVTVVATRVALGVPRAGMMTGVSRQLSATLRGEGEREFGPPRNAMWSSSAPDIASVDSAGTVTAKAPGVATITVQQHGAGTDSASVYVTGRVLVSGIIGTRRGLWQLMRATDTVATLIAAVDSANITQAVWSPDRTMIAATLEPAEKSGGPRVVVMTAAGAGMRVISGGADVASDPAWTTDGRAVLASVRRGTEWLVARLPIDGTEITTLASGGQARLRYPQATRDPEVVLARGENNSRADIVRIRGGVIIQSLTTPKPREELFTLLQDGRLLIAIDSSGKTRPTTLAIATSGDDAYLNPVAVPLPAGFVISDVSAGDADNVVIVTGRTRRYDRTGAPALIVFRVQLDDGQARPLLVLTERDAVTARAR